MQRPHKAYPVELAQFHSADYVEFLHRITPDTLHLYSNELAKCKILICKNSHELCIRPEYRLWNFKLQVHICFYFAVVSTLTRSKIEPFFHWI